MSSSAAPETTHAAVGSPSRSVFHSLKTSDVVLGSGELGRWQQRNQSVTIPHAIRELEKAGNLANFVAVADANGADYRGSYPFLDTDVYKMLEGVAYELGARQRDKAEAGCSADLNLLRFYEQAVTLIARAQRLDGYLNTAFQNPRYGHEPWSDMTWGHELYNLGHLIQAALAAQRQLGDDRLLQVAIRFADLVFDRFGPEGDPLVCGHPGVEMALVELSRETTDERYLALAKLFIDRRGHRSIEASAFEHDYFQDDEPLRTLPSITGHAVRMAYLGAGAADVAIDTHDADLLAALEQLWDDMVASKLHLSGGLGSRHTDESIGDRYELSPERSYSETCAAIGVMQWGWRMFLATGTTRFVDVFERVLYNAYAAGISEDGNCFFYDNPLQRRADHRIPAAGAPLREPWFVCACCPPNVVRWTAELQDHIAVTSDRGLHIVNFTRATVRSDQFTIEMDTDFPWSGVVRFRIVDAADGTSALALRVPAWAAGATLEIDGRSREVQPGGSVREERVWAPGTELILRLPMPIRAWGGHPHLDAVRGNLAITRGPLLYCVEGLDADGRVDDLLVAHADVLTARASEYEVSGGLKTAHVSIALSASLASPSPPELYPELSAPAIRAGEPIEIVLRPYHLWGNREASTMRVWIRAG